MKIRLNEKQYNMLREASNEKTYVANFEILIGAVSDEDAIAQLEIMKKQIVSATKNGEVYPSLYEKAPFGSEPRKIA